MRVYFVVQDTNPVKKDAAARAEIKSRMQVSDLEDNAPNRRLNFGKVSPSGDMWFGGIDLDVPALEKLADRRKGEALPEEKLQALLQEEIRAAVAAGERTRLTVEIVAASEDEGTAMIAAQQWLAANWEYSDDKSDPRTGR